jgi:hypothetical protein
MAKRRFLKHHPKVEQRKGTVALIGMGPSLTSFLTDCLTQEYEPNHADEVWAINMASNVVWHDVVIWMDDLDQQEQFKPGLISALRRRKKPVLTTVSKRDIVPLSYDIPIDELTALSIPIFGKAYFNSGVALAIAYAIYKGVKTLKLYGCDFTYPDRNYAEAGRGCTEAWMALASASGMNLVLPEATSLFDAVEVDKGIYGYTEQPIINLPGGSKYYPGEGGRIDHVTEPAITEESGEYVAEDTSPEGSKKVTKDKEDAVQRRVPRTNGSAAPASGSAGLRPERAERAPLAAAKGLGDGVRGGD